MRTEFETFVQSKTSSYTVKSENISELLDEFTCTHTNARPHTCKHTSQIFRTLVISFYTVEF